MLAASGSIAQPFTALNIGTRSPSAADTDFFAGLIDEVIIYERPLSAGRGPAAGRRQVALSAQPLEGYTGRRTTKRAPPPVGSS